jgi:hypothetical protein
MMTFPAASEPTLTARPTRTAPIVSIALVLLIVFGWAALTVDFVRTSYGVKSDEATYVSMAFSLAYDGDLTYQRADLQRFWSVFHNGPEGIFLKRGQDLDVDFSASWPPVHIVKHPDPDTSRLYFGKAFIYPLLAAPFVRLAGLNGMLLLNVLLLVGVVACAGLFACARSTGGGGLPLALAFVGASVVPLYGVWLTPEVFNFATVFFALFLWLYKYVAPRSADERPNWLQGRGSDVAAAIILGLATFSKPLNVLLIGPMVLTAWWQRRFARGWLIGIVFAATVVVCFSANAVVSGELNYQGGDRKTFYGHFPEEAPGATFATLGGSMATNEIAIATPPGAYSFWRRLALNTEYFFIGRDFGFVPYYFPGLVILVLWFKARGDLGVPQILILASVVASVLILLIILPFTWSGGGGPPGNRYFISLYPALFFLLPPIRTPVAAIAAWVGGSLCTAQMLVNPFVASKFPWQNVDHGPARFLPVELTMVNDLPVRLDQLRSRIPYGANPSMNLYYMDRQAYNPELGGMWIAGAARADIIVRTAAPLTSLQCVITSPIANHVKVTFSGHSAEANVGPGRPATLTLPAGRGVYAYQAYDYLLSVRTRAGFTPAITSPGSTDSRFLGAFVKLQGIQ